MNNGQLDLDMYYVDVKTGQLKRKPTTNTPKSPRGAKPQSPRGATPKSPRGTPNDKPPKGKGKGKGSYAKTGSHIPGPQKFFTVQELSEFSANPFGTTNDDPTAYGDADNGGAQHEEVETGVDEAEEYTLRDDERCAKINGQFFVFDVETYNNHFDNEHIEVWPDMRPGVGDLCFAYNTKRRCTEPECPCASGERCRNVGPGLTCNVPDCPRPTANHNHWSCHFKFEKLGAKGKLFAQKKLAKAPTNFPSKKGKGGKSNSKSFR